MSFAGRIIPAIANGPDNTAYDAAALAYFNQIVANGAAPLTRGQKAAINTYVVAEKAVGNWNQDGQYLFYSSDPLVAKINLAQPSLYALTFIGTYTLSTTRGFNTDGTTGYADTGVNHSALVNMTQNNGHVSSWALAKGNFQLGLAGTSSGMKVAVGSTKATRVNGSTDISDTALAGYNYGDRTGSTTITTGNNGSVQTAGGAQTSAALLAFHVLIGRTNTSSMPVNTNQVFASFGAAIPNEAARYVNLRTMLLALGISVP